MNSLIMRGEICILRHINSGSDVIIDKTSHTLENGNRKVPKHFLAVTQHHWYQSNGSKLIETYQLLAQYIFDALLGNETIDSFNYL